jgi:16S rRNA (guanine527-N7)-methyltransferase
MNQQIVSEFIQHHFTWADPGSGERIHRYLAELEKWNNRINLTGIPVAGWLEKIVAESAALVIPVLQKKISAEPGDIWIDMGTGAGLPGLIIAAMLPSQAIWLVDAKQKKTSFLQNVISKIHLKNARVVQNRLETLSVTYPELRQNVSVLFSRALAGIDQLIAYADTLAAPGAVLISPRGGTTTQKHVLLQAKRGRIWSGYVWNLPVPGFDRAMACVKLSLEASDNG